MKPCITFAEGSARKQWNSVVSPIYNELERRGEVEVQYGGKGDYYVYCRGIAPQVAERGIYIPHGVSLPELNSDLEQEKKITRSLGCLLPGPLWLDELKKLHHKEHHEKLKLVGWPKSDILFSPQRDEIRREVRDALGLKKEKTILWADCHLHLPIEDSIKRHPGILKVWDSLKESRNKNDLNLIIKPHVGPGRIPDTFDIPDNLKEEGVFWVNPIEWGNIMKLFLVADILVTIGFSSVSVEFLLMNKPIVFWDHGYLSGKAGVQSASEEVGEKVLDTLSHDEYKDQRQEWLKKLVYKPDGHSAERAADAIMELID